MSNSCGRRNALAVLRELFLGPQSLDELAASTGLGRRTIERIIGEARALGFDVELDSAPGCVRRYRLASVRRIPPGAEAEGARGGCQVVAEGA